jgi:hypothetical protein
MKANLPAIREGFAQDECLYPEGLQRISISILIRQSEQKNAN